MKAFLSVIGLSLVLTGCATTGGQTPTDSQRSVVPQAQIDTKERRRARIRLELAAQHYQNRNYPTALDELRRAIDADPKYASAYNMLGLIYMDLKDDARAEQSFKEALKLTPDDADTNNNYGWFLCQSGRERDAVTWFEKAARDPLGPSPSKPLHNAGVSARLKSIRVTPLPCSTWVKFIWNAPILIRRSFMPSVWSRRMNLRQAPCGWLSKLKRPVAIATACSVWRRSFARNFQAQ